MISDGAMHVLMAGFGLLAAITMLAMRHGETVGTLRGKLHNAIGSREVTITVRRAGRKGDPVVKLQFTQFGAMSSVSMDAAEARQFADILDAAAARSGG